METAGPLATLDTKAAARGAGTAPATVPADETSFSPREFRNALGRFATGVTVVTMQVQGAAPPPEGAAVRSYGLTVNAFMSVSLDPPLVAVAIDKKARAHATLLGAPQFGVSVLAHEQEGLSDLFAGRPVAAPERPFEQLVGFPVVAGALTQLVCSMYQAHDVGDHTIFVGRVEALRYTEGQPLLFFRGQYDGLRADPAVP